jgi:hypothetical protein
VAFDSAGAGAVKDFIRPPELAQALFDFMGWDRSLSEKAAAPTYPCLIDERHVVAERYGMVNVPTAVWIDEDGFMARPPEPAGASDMFRGMDRQTFVVPPDDAEAGRRTKSFYVEALCDWIERGKQSRHALPPDEVRRRLRGLSRGDSMAAASFRLGLWLAKRGEGEAAAKQFDAAVRLRPESWNFRRQKIVLSDPALTGQFAATPEFWDAVDALGEKGYYYPPIRMEGIPPPPRPRVPSARS